MKLPENEVSREQIKTATKSTPLNLGTSFCEETKRSIEFFLVDRKINNKPAFTLMAHSFIGDSYVKTSDLASSKKNKVGVLEYFNEELSHFSFAELFGVIDKHGDVRGEK